MVWYWLLVYTITTFIVGVSVGLILPDIIDLDALFGDEEAS